MQSWTCSGSITSRWRTTVCGTTVPKENQQSSLTVHMASTGRHQISLANLRLYALALIRVSLWSWIMLCSDAFVVMGQQYSTVVYFMTRMKVHQSFWQTTASYLLACLLYLLPLYVLGNLGRESGSDITQVLLTINYSMRRFCFVHVSLVVLLFYKHNAMLLI